MSGRKIGVGFNRPRVLGQHKWDVAVLWSVYRKRARLVRFNPRPWHIPLAASAVEVSRRYRRDARW